MSKPRVAIFDFACCEGCQLQILNLENELLDHEHHPAVGLVDPDVLAADHPDASLVAGDQLAEGVAIPVARHQHEGAVVVREIGSGWRHGRGSQHKHRTFGCSVG